MTRSRLRRLSEEQASSCENAISPPSECRCRCGGRFHGAARGIPLELLPLDDPHTRQERAPRSGGSAPSPDASLVLERLAQDAGRLPDLSKALRELIDAVLEDARARGLTERELPEDLRLAVATARLELLET